MEVFTSLRTCAAIVSSLRESRVVDTALAYTLDTSSCQKTVQKLLNMPAQDAKHKTHNTCTHDEILN